MRAGVVAIVEHGDNASGGTAAAMDALCSWIAADSNRRGLRWQHSKVERETRVAQTAEAGR